jgi:hypothetical protein
MCCLLAIASTDNIFTAFSIYKVRVKESCKESTGGQGEIYTYPTDVNKSTDREQRSASILLTSHKHSADGIMLPIRPNTSSLSTKTVNDLIFISDEASNEHVG